MQNSEFEKSMQQRMDELKFVPSDAVWKKVEAGLPEPKNPRRWLLFFLLFIILSGATLLLKNYFSPLKENQATALLSKNKINVNQDMVEQIKIKESNIKTGDVLLKNKQQVKEYIGKGNVKDINVSLKDNFGIENNPSEINSGNDGSNYKIKFKTRQKVKMVIKPSVAVFDEALENSAGSDSNEMLSNTTIMTADSMTAISEMPKHDIQTNPPDSLKQHINDTLSTVSKNPFVNKKKTTNWQYGINVGAGISTVKSGLFGNSPVYADVLGNYSPGIPNSPTSPNAQLGSPYSPKPSASFNLGAYVKNKINKRWIFNTGLNYSYQSNIIKIGSRVDSMANFNFAGTNFQAAQFYRNGQTDRYKNAFHLASIPLLFQYDVSKKNPLYVEMGSSISYLIYSNTQIYSISRNAYLTNEGMFNKILLSVNGGAGFDLSKNSKLPFSVGYRFSYSIGSATKTTYSKQHLLNSIFFLDIPLQK